MRYYVCFHLENFFGQALNSDDLESMGKPLIVLRNKAVLEADVEATLHEHLRATETVIRYAIGTQVTVELYDKEIIADVVYTLKEVFEPVIDEPFLDLVKDFAEKLADRVELRTRASVL